METLNLFHALKECEIRSFENRLPVFLIRKFVNGEGNNLYLDHEILCSACFNQKKDLIREHQIKMLDCDSEQYQELFDKLKDLKEPVLIESLRDPYREGAKHIDEKLPPGSKEREQYDKFRLS